MSINQTRLRRRIEKYSSAVSGGKTQTGITQLESGAGIAFNTIKQWRNGREVSEPLLERIDKYLSDRGF